MARLARNEIEAGIWHIWARGVERRLIFLDDEDRLVYVSLLRGVVDRFDWWCLGYCLMPNHVHLIIETRRPNLGRGMHSLHGGYADHFNRRWDRVGHLFQSRFGSRAIHDERQLATVASYVAVNPVAASLCVLPEDWEWSSRRSGGDGRGDGILARTRLDSHLSALGAPDDVYDTFVEARLLNREPLSPA